MILRHEKFGTCKFGLGVSFGNDRSERDVGSVSCF